MAINGGTLNIEAPSRYFEDAKGLLHEIGIDLDRFQSANQRNRQLYRSQGLSNAYFFDKETWGEDRLVVNENTANAAGDGAGGRGGRGRSISPEFLARTPLSATAQRDLLRLYDGDQPDYLPGLASAEKSFAWRR